jgi:hypothetical protein
MVGLVDPPYSNDGVPLYEPLGAFAFRVLRPGRLAVVYAGHLQLDREMELLARGGLTYMWHGANVLRGRHTRVRTRMVFGQHRSVLLYSAGPYRPRTWLNDIVFAEVMAGRRSARCTRGSTLSNQSAIGSARSQSRASRSSTHSAARGRRQWRQ